MLSHCAIHFNQLSSNSFYVEFGCCSVAGGRRRENLIFNNEFIGIAYYIFNDDWLQGQWRERVLFETCDRCQ